MSRRAGRVMLVVVLAGVIALAGAQLWRLDRSRLQAETATQEFEAVAQRISRAVVSARAGERAYVATGQGHAFWQPGVDRALQGIREDLPALKATAAGDLTPKLDAVLSALTDVTRLEKRIVDHAAAGRIPHASDLIFADGLQASLTLERATDDLIATNRAALGAKLAATRWQELTLVGAIGAAGLLVALLLLPLPEQAARREETSGEPSPADAKAADTKVAPRTTPVRTEKPAEVTRAAEREKDKDRTGPIRAIGLNLSGASDAPAAPPVNTPRPSTPVPSRDTSSHSSLGLNSPTPSSTSGSTDAAGSSTFATNGRQGGATDLRTLTSAAALCSAFARASDAHDLDSLLPQMAEQLDAVGLIVWLRDDEGRALKAALSHGYPRQTLAALPAIDATAENATARAARLAQPQVVAASGTTPGALVVPMLTAAGCVGVVSIELPPGLEHDESTSALARIFAAQLAMLTA